MKDTLPHLRALQEIERGGIPGLLEMLHEEGIDGVRYALWDTTGWHRDHRDYSPAWRDRATEEQLSLPGSRLYFPGYGFAR